MSGHWIPPTCSSDEDCVQTARKIAILVDPIALSRKGGDHAAQLARELLGQGATVRAFGAPPGSLPQSSSEHGTTLAQYAPDAILAYDAVSPAAWIGALHARKHHIPLVLIEGDASLAARRLRHLGLWIFGPTVRRTASALVALDPQAEQRLLAQKFARERVTRIPPGVDLEEYRPGLTSGLVHRHHIRGRLLLYAGHLSEGRGLELLISAYARTLSQNGDWNLALAGDGPLRSRLRTQVERLGIASSVHWLGEVGEAELPGLLGASTLLLVPGTSPQVRGQNIPRALASGLPVISSDLPALHYLVRPGENGLLAKAGDLEGWCAALQRAAIDPEQRRRWSRSARSQAESELSWKQVGREIAARLGALELSPVPSSDCAYPRRTA